MYIPALQSAVAMSDYLERVVGIYDSTYILHQGDGLKKKAGKKREKLAHLQDAVQKTM